MKEKKKQRGRTGAVGFCRSCEQEHILPAAPAEKTALQLMKTLESEGRIDFARPSHRADPRCSADYLWGPARGKMFGVLIAQAPNGEQVVFRAFSGQYNGLWQVPGWVGPVFDCNAFHQVHDDEERAIKKLTRQIDLLLLGCPERQKLVQLRKKNHSSSCGQSTDSINYGTSRAGRQAWERSSARTRACPPAPATAVPRSCSNTQPCTD